MTNPAITELAEVLFGLRHDNESRARLTRALEALLEPIEAKRNDDGERDALAAQVTTLVEKNRDLACRWVTLERHAEVIQERDALQAELAMLKATLDQRTGALAGVTEECARLREAAI